MDSEKIVISQNWKETIIVILLLATLFYAANMGAVWELVDQWIHSDTYGHGILMIPITLYLIWSDRQRILSASPENSWLGLLFVVGVVMASIVASILDVDAVDKASLVFMLMALVWAFAGFSVFMRLLFPLGFLFLAIPIWSWLELLLQDMTSSAVAMALGWINIPVFLEGNYLTLPVGRFFVDDVCAGLRFVLAGLAIFLLFMHMNISNPRSKIVFMLVTLFVLTMVNWIRVFIVVYAGYVTDMQHSLVDDHVGFGWVVFAVTMVPLFILGRRLSDR